MRIANTASCSHTFRIPGSSRRIRWSKVMAWPPFTVGGEVDRFAIGLEDLELVL